MSLLRLLSLLCLLGCLLPTAALAIEPLEFADRSEEQRYQRLLRELRCLQCQNQSLADSDANVASGLRMEVFRQMRAGRSDAEIKAWLVERYGEFVLYRPEVKSSTWLLWFGPFLILGLAGLVVFLHFRRRARAHPHAAASRAQPYSDSEDW